MYKDSYSNDDLEMKETRISNDVDEDSDSVDWIEIQKKLLTSDSPVYKGVRKTSYPKRKSKVKFTAKDEKNNLNYVSGKDLGSVSYTNNHNTSDLTSMVCFAIHFNDSTSSVIQLIMIINDIYL